MAKKCVTVSDTITEAKKKEIAAEIGGREALKVADKIYQETQKRVPVRTGRLKASGYIKQIVKGYKVGYAKDYAIPVDKMPQSVLSGTGNGGISNFFTGVVLKYKNKYGGDNDEL